MISGSVLVLFSKALDLLAHLIDLVRRGSRIGEKQKRTLVCRLLFEDLQGDVARLRQFSQAEKELAELELHLPVFRAQLCGSLEQRIRLQYLALTLVNES